MRWNALFTLSSLFSRKFQKNNPPTLKREWCTFYLPNNMRGSYIKRTLKNQTGGKITFAPLFQTRRLRGLYLIFPSSDGKNSLSRFLLIWLRRESEYVTLVESFQGKTFKLKYWWSNRNYFIYLITKTDFFISEENHVEFYCIRFIFTDSNYKTGCW